MEMKKKNTSNNYNGDGPLFQVLESYTKFKNNICVCYDQTTHKNI